MKTSVVRIEGLEARRMMNGTVSVFVSSGDLFVSGDSEDNVIKITRPAVGKIRVAGLDGTKVNGASFKDFSAAFDDLKIRMRQGGEDEVAVQGPITFTGDLDAQMGNGQLVVEGSAGAVDIGDRLYVIGGARCDVGIRNEVIVRGNATIQTGGAVDAAAGLGILPDFKSARFSNSLDIDNPYFPLVPGTVYTYEEKSVDDETGEMVTERIVVEVTNQTKTILGVVNRVLRDRVYRDGLLIEDTFDWHAQDDNGNVWYFGEKSTDFEYDDDGNLIGTSTATSWQAGVGGAKPGVIMMARPAPGNKYYQEFQPGVALDQGEVLSNTDTARVPVGTFSKVVRTRDTSVLSPDGLEHKLYAPGLGLVQEISYDVQTGEVDGTLNLISAKRNGTNVKQVVSPTVTGTNVTGTGTGPIRMFGETVITAGGPVLVKQSRFADEIMITSRSGATVWDTTLEDITVQAGDSVGFRNVTATEEVIVRGNIDVYVFKSRFNYDVEITLGNGDNELVIGGSTIADLDADGGAGFDTFDDAGGNHFGELELTRFEED